MPIGPEGQKRSADVHVMKALRGKAEATGLVGDGKDKVAQELGREGEAARAVNMTPERRAETALKAAEACYAKRR